MQHAINFYQEVMMNKALILPFLLRKPLRLSFIHVQGPSGHGD